jgi:tetratricopeptide (TPR) repeat protein/transcriptional regulator with XRE-family HTH domain
MVPLDEPEPREVDRFGALLQAWRRQAGLTQERLAERAGLSARTIRALERGHAHPRADTARLLGDALGLDEATGARFHAAARRAPHAPGPIRPAATAGPATKLVVPAQLPADVAGFVGREQHLRELDALLDSVSTGHQGDARGRAVVISAIAGTAGVGKTALAVRWAHRVRQHFPDGQLYLNLHGYAQGLPLVPLQALAQLLGGLGVAAEQIPVEVEEAAGLYRSLLADRQMLVVLDNARDAEQVRPLIPGAPGCLVVVSSRNQLAGLVASHGAHRLTLDVLSLQEAVDLLGQIVGDERVHAEPGAAAELAETCGFLPLALRIAAANLTNQPGQSIADYLARLQAGDRLTELAVDGDPQAAVRNAFDCSYARLDADAQRLFRLLGLVPGPDFTSEAAAALTGMPVRPAAWVLQRLASANLIEQRALGRYGLHDLLRCYARQRTEGEAAEQERRQALGRLLHWYLHTADAADRLLNPQMLRLPLPAADPRLPPAGFDGRASALGWLNAERPNLVAAARHAAAHGLGPLAWLLADSLRGYFWGHRYMLDWLAVAHAGRAAAEAEGDLQAQAAAHRNLGMAHWCLGEYAKAARRHTSALALARQAGWLDGEAATLGNLGVVYTELGQLKRAADHHAQALTLYRQSGYKAGQAVALGNLGDVLLQMGRPKLAADHLLESLTLHQEIGAQVGQAASLGTLGQAYHDLGRLDDAGRYLDQSLVLARAVGDRYDEADNLIALAIVRRDAGRSATALELAEAGLTLAREIGEPRIEAEALNTIGSIHLCLGHRRKAAQHHREALDVACHSSARYPHAEALLGLAATCQLQGQPKQALQHAGHASSLACEAGFRILEGRAYATLAAVDLDLDQHGEAVGHARRAVAIFRDSGNQLGHARALVTLGHALHRRGYHADARLCWQEALGLLVDVGAPDAGHVRALLHAQ